MKKLVALIVLGLVIGLVVGYAGGTITKTVKTVTKTQIKQVSNNVQVKDGETFAMIQPLFGRGTAYKIPSASNNYIECVQYTNAARTQRTVVAGNWVVNVCVKVR